MSETPEMDPYQPPGSEIGEGGEPSPFKEGFRSVLIWGGIPQGLGLALALLGWPFGGWKGSFAGLFWLSTGPIFLLALFSGLGRSAYIHRFRWDREEKRGAFFGGWLFFGLWILTSFPTCALLMSQFTF